MAFDKNNSVWGFYIEREIRRNNEKLRWASPTRLRSMWTLQGLGKLKGLNDLKKGIGLDLRPTLLTRYRSLDGSESDFDLEPSFDAFYRLTPSLTATMTWQTDFAETDVDERQVNTTRFPLFFPEKLHLVLSYLVSSYLRLLLLMPWCLLYTFPHTNLVLVWRYLQFV